MLYQGLVFALLGGLAQSPPPLPPLDDLLRDLNSRQEAKRESERAESLKNDARHALWPRPVITETALDDARDVYQPPQTFIVDVVAAHSRYRESLVDVIELAGNVRDGTVDGEIAAHLSQELIVPPSLAHFKFPGVDSNEDTGWRADPDDPRWQVLAAAEQRIARRNRAVWIRLRAINIAFVGELEELGAFHGFGLAPEYVSRVLLNTCLESTWSPGHGAMPELADVSTILPPLLGSADSASIAEWARIAEHLGDSGLLLPFQMASQRALQSHDAGIRDLVLRAIRRLPSASGYSGLGGLPTTEEAMRAIASVVERWQSRDSLNSAAFLTLTEELSPYGEEATFLIREQIALSRLSSLRKANDAAPIAIQVAPLIPQSAMPDCTPLLSTLSKIGALHAEHLYSIASDLAVETALASGARTHQGDLLRREMHQAIKSYESKCTRILNELTTHLGPELSHEVTRMSSQWIEARRPHGVSVD